MSEPCFRKKSYILCLSPLTAARHDKHVDVKQLRFGRFRAMRDDALDDEKACPVRHSAAAGLKNAYDVRVVPIMDHALQEVEVSTSWHALEEIAGAEGPVHHDFRAPD